jgi:hypothetical protein
MDQATPMDKTDIVARLRDEEPSNGLELEAADEIVRLRQALIGTKTKTATAYNVWVDTVIGSATAGREQP